MPDSDIIPFSFEGQSVRVVAVGGEPAFVGKDVCERLGYVDPTTAIRSHCKGVQKRHPLMTPGGMQQVRILFMPDVLRLIAGSTLPEAERMERWMFEEVLPSVIKTGSYGRANAAKPRAIGKLAAIGMAHRVLANVPGVDKAMAAAVTLRVIADETGVSTEPFRAALPAIEERRCTLNATALGAMLSVSAQTANRMLAARRLQFKNERGEWILTEEGRQYGEVLPFNRNGHSGYQIFWSKEVAGLFDMEDAA